LVAKGRDKIALGIRELAGEHKVPVVESPPLARALYASVEIDQPIKLEHYAAVAEIISYVLRLTREKKSG
jgi:flagellar biosynthetic protein FlhB